MIILDTLDMARLKVLVPKFVKWIFKNYGMAVSIGVLERKDNKFVMTDDLSNFIKEHNIKDLTIGAVGRKEDLPLSVFMMKNFPKYISVAIDHQKMEFDRIIINYVIGRNAERRPIETVNFCPFKYGLELDPLHNGLIEIMRIDKETSEVNIVNSEGKVEKSLGFGYFYGYYYSLVNHFKEENIEHKKNFDRALKSEKLLGFNFRTVWVSSMRFTKPLPVEKDIKAYLMRYLKVVV